MTDPRILDEILRLNPPFALLIQAAYKQGVFSDRVKLREAFPDIIKEIPK